MVGERYTYLPYLGLFFGLGMIIDKFIESNATKSMVIIALSLTFAACSFTRLKVWKNNETLFTDIINKYPEISTPYNIRGDIYSKEENLEAALADYTKAITLDPESFEGYVNRGVVYFKGKMYVEAIEDYNKAEKLKPNFDKVYLNRGVCYKSLNNFEAALKDFNKVIEKEPCHQIQP